MINISPQKNWQRKTRLAFVLFCVVSAGLLGGIAMKIKYVTSAGDLPKTKDVDLVKVIVIWFCTLVIWLSFRKYYKLLAKNSNKLRE